MSKTLIVPNGILTTSESKAECPECERQIPVEEIETNYIKQGNQVMRMKCKCKRFIGISTDMLGDFIAFKWN